MREMMKWLAVGALVVLLSACGGGGGVDTTPPTFTSSSTVTVPENQTDALTLQATDISTPITYSIGEGDSAEFNVDSETGKVAFKTAPDYETKTSYTFTAKATDAKGNEATQDVTIAISDIDEIAPTFTSAATVTVPENQTDALTLHATDTSTPITYSISGGDSSSFSVDSTTGVVTFNTAPDYETKTSYTFTATATDAKGNKATQDVTIAISDIDEIAPTFTSAATVTVPENQTDALTLHATDTSTPITYSISGGDSSSFSVDSTTGVVTFNTAPDFETRDTYGFTAKATDAVGNEATQDIAINISDLPEGQLKKTGQTKSYNENGTEVADGSIKDDGYYQKGVTPNYTRNDTAEVVTDHVTGLEWQDDANVSTVTKPWLTQTNYDICTGQNGQTQDTSKCTDTSGDTAATYCSSLSLGGFTDWRLPTIDELMYIADRSKANPAIDTSYFENVVSGYYWSSTAVVGDEGGAWSVGFYLGGDDWGDKSGSGYVRCVRDGQ